MSVVGDQVVLNKAAVANYFAVTEDLDKQTLGSLVQIMAYIHDTAYALRKGRDNKDEEETDGQHD